MDVLFALDEGTVNDIMERMPDPPSYFNQQPDNIFVIRASYWFGR